MVVVKALSRNPLDFVRESGHEAPRTYVNLDKNLHRFERAVEYTRAVNAAKLQKMFSKPFVCALERHTETVQRLALHPTQHTYLLSGDCAGDIILWNTPKKEVLQHIANAHRGFVNGLAFIADGSCFLSCSSDKTAKMWKSTGQVDAESNIKPINTYSKENEMTWISSHETEMKFATAGSDLSIWDIHSNEPVQTYKWGNDHSHHCVYNRSQTDLILSCNTDRSICLFDTRLEHSVHKMMLKKKANATVWNPLNPMEFCCASDDWKVYVFDIRHPKKAQVILTGHVDCVTCVDYSPTGREIVSGGYDKTLRLWNMVSDEPSRSRDCYHGKRMQKIWSCCWSLDNTFIYSGSEESNVRVWKSQSNVPLKNMNFREKRSLDYSNKLKERFKYFPEVRKILKQCYIPKEIKKKQKVLSSMTNAKRRREKNVNDHRRNKVKPVPERIAAVLKSDIQE